MSDRAPPRGRSGVGADNRTRSPASASGARAYRRLAYPTRTVTRSCGGGGYPAPSSQPGSLEPRPVASTTRSASSRSSALPSARAITRAPTTRRVSDEVTRPTTSRPPRTRTPARATTRHRIAASRVGRLTQTAVSPDDPWRNREPPKHSRVSASMSPTGAPIAGQLAREAGEELLEHVVAACEEAVEMVGLWSAPARPEVGAERVAVDDDDLGVGVGEHLGGEQARDAPHRARRPALGRSWSWQPPPVRSGYRLPRCR